MKKVVTTVMAGLIGIICFGQTPIKKVEKFPNGKIEHEYYVIEYKKIDQTYHTTDITHRQVGGTSTKLYLRHGSEKLYWDNGNMQIETNYYKNLYNGTYKRYHYNGKIAEEGTWSYGTRKGVHKFYDSNGNLREEIDFSNSSDYTKGTYKLLTGNGKIIADGKLHQKYYSKAPDKKDSELALNHGEANYAEIAELTVYDNDGNKTFFAEFSETHPLRIYRYKEHPESFKNLFAILKFIKYENATFTKYQLYPETDKLIVDYTASLDKNNNPLSYNYNVYSNSGKIRLSSIINSEQKLSTLYNEDGMMIAQSQTLIEPFAKTYDRFISNIGEIFKFDFEDAFNKMIHQEENTLRYGNSTHYYPSGEIYQKINVTADGIIIKGFDKKSSNLYELSVSYSEINSSKFEFIPDIIGFMNFKYAFDYFIKKKYTRSVIDGTVYYDKKKIISKYNLLNEQLSDTEELLKLYFKMFSLYNQDTKEFEKLIKKEKDVNKLKELFEI